MKRIFKNRAARITATVLGAGLLAVAAYASVTFDPNTGMGFVGKGDVQVPFGWNNATLQTQANAGNIAFTYEAVSRYAITCEWYTGPVQNRRPHLVDHTRTSNVNNTVDHANRRNPQSDVTGFNLTGWGSVSESGFDPNNPSCPGEDGTDAIVVAGPTFVSSSGGLYVSDNTTSSGPALIWTAP
jgi:hypothetical protein